MRRASGDLLREGTGTYTPLRVLRCAYLLALGSSPAEAAERLHVSADSVRRWSRNPKYDAAFQAVRQRVARKVEQVLTTDKIQRILKLQKHLERIERTIDARAKSEDLQRFPGGEEGLTTYEVKSVGSGESAERTEVYKFDTALDKALRETLEQFAKESGGLFQRPDTNVNVQVNTSVITTSDTQAAVKALMMNEQAREI